MISNILDSEHPWVPDVINTKSKTTQEICTIAQEVWFVSGVVCSSWHEGRYNIFQHTTCFYFPTLTFNLQLELPNMHISCSTIALAWSKHCSELSCYSNFFPLIRSRTLCDDSILTLLKTGGIGDTALSFLMQTISWGQKLSIVQKQTCAVQNNGVKPDLPRWEPRKTNSAKGPIAKW